MSRPYRHDVIVVGAGVVGTACALALSQMGLDVGLIEKGPGPQVRAKIKPLAFDTKVVALNLSTVHFLAHLGGWSARLAKRACGFQKMCVWDRQGFGKIEFFAHEVGRAQLGAIVEQNVLLGELWNTLIETPNVQTYLNRELTQSQFGADQAHLSDGHAHWHAQLVVGADGVCSWVSAQLGLKYQQWSYHQEALVATLQCQRPHQSCAYQWFSPQGPLAFLPLADPHYVSIVWSTTAKHAQELLNMPTVAFEQALRIQSQGQLGAVSLKSPRHHFPLTMRHAQQYGQARGLCVGDSLHTLHPLAGQGLNLGLQDVAVLCDVLKGFKTKQRDLGQLRVVQRFQRRRRPEVLKMVAVMEAFKRGFESQNPILNRLRNIGLNWVDHNGWLKNQWVRMMMDIEHFPVLNVQGD